jgi:tetratricopeptide (TPR) repeat protein
MTRGARAGRRSPSARFARAAPAIARIALSSALLSALLSVLLSGCSAAPPVEAVPTLDRELAAFLLDPSPLAAAPVAGEVARVHRGVLAGADPRAAVREADAIASRAPEDAGARLLLAQMRLAGGEAAAALAELARIPQSFGRRPEVALTAGRAAEQVGDLVAAVSWYRLAGGNLAGERVRALEPRALEILHARGTDQIARGWLDDAEQTLALLEQWRAADPESLELSRAIAVARADPRRELAALRALAPARPEELDLQLRRGALEVEIGDARIGLELLSALAAKRPNDPHVADELERAKLVFRLANAPEAVRSAAGRAQLSRGDLALLLFWLVPDVRSARGGAPRIASDILDHPAREEIMRVVNIGLLPVDEARHLFEPQRAVRRAEALRAFLLNPAGGGWRPCANRAAGDACAAAQACGLLVETGECLPSAPLSGREAVDWIVRIPESR